MRRQIAILAGCFCALLPYDQTLAAGGYLNVDGGANFKQDTKVFTYGSPREVTFNPGMRFDLDVGYRFNKALSIGVNTGYIYNSVDTFAVPPLDDWYIDITDLHQIPWLAVLAYEFQNKSRILPFVSVGAGGVLGLYEGNQYDWWGFSSPRDAGGIEYPESGYAVTIAYQVGAGGRYRIRNSMELGLIYKLFGTEDLKFNSHDIDTLDGGLNHSVALTFRFEF